MLKNYELLYIVHPDLEGSIEKVTEKVANYITKAKGEIVAQEEWGKRKLAYPIAKNNFGIYVLVNFKLDSLKLSDIERELRISEEIIRSMIVIEPEKKEIVEEKKPIKAKKEDIPASIIVKEEEPVAKEEIQEEVEAEKPKKTTRKKKEVVEDQFEEKTEEVTTYEAVEEEKRKEILDEKLDEILGNSKKKAK